MESRTCLHIKFGVLNWVRLIGCPLWLIAPSALLNDIHFDHLTASIKNALSQKYQYCTVRNYTYLTTYIISHHSEAHWLNQLLLDNLQTGQQIQYHITDYEENQIIHGHSNTHTFSWVTNLPDIVTLAIGAKVMYLTNTLLSQGICNRSCGVITTIEPSTYPVVTFPTSDGIKVINSHFLSSLLSCKILLTIQPRWYR